MIFFLAAPVHLYYALAYVLLPLIMHFLPLSVASMYDRCRENTRVLSLLHEHLIRVDIGVHRLL